MRRNMVEEKKEPGGSGVGEVRRPRLWYDSPIDRGGGERLVVRYRLLSLYPFYIQRKRSYERVDVVLQGGK